MTRFSLGLSLALVLLSSGCSRGEQAGGRDGGAGIQEVDGMPGMSAVEGGGPGAASDSGVPIHRANTERLGITFARAAMGPIRRGTRVVGTLTYAEPRREYVNARVMGWVEELYADFHGKPVKKGEPLLALYSPELVSAQEELLSALRLGDSTLAAAARRRLGFWNVAEDQIAEIERSGTAQRRIVLRAPRSGELAEKRVTEGQAVQAGDNLFLIADRSVLWADLAVFESDAPILRIGTPVVLKSDAAPGRTFRGRVSFIQPQVDEKSRTLSARVEVANPDGTLRPGMYAIAQLAPAARERLSVPLTAVLPTGTRELVFVNRGDGAFVPREVETGVRGDSLVEIVAGLKAGDEVVASATYLLDSETNLASAMHGLMLQMGMGLDMGGMQMGDSTREPR
jgi:membrane fusion protein, copper/silver efflux system